MPRRSTSLNNYTGTAITREIDSKYDNVKIVADNIDALVTLSEADFASLVTALNDAKDFTGITVVTGESASWDAVNKILTVPQGEAGADGINGTDGTDGASAYELAVANGYVGTVGQWLSSLKGATGATGINGLNGQTPSITISYNDETGDLEYSIVYTDPTSNTLDKEW